MAFCCVCLQIGCSVTNTDDSLTIVYSGNLDGSIEPCGCSTGGNFGGIMRRANAIDSLRKETKNIVLLSTGGLFVTGQPQDIIKGEYILRGLKKMRYDSIGIQRGDLSFGVDFLTNHSLPYTSSNWMDDEFAKRQVVKRGKKKIEIFSWLDPALGAQSLTHSTDSVSGDVAPLLKGLSEAKQKERLTVLATTLTLPETLNLVSLENVDILLIKADDEMVADPLEHNRTLVLKHGLRGMRLGRLDLSIDAFGGVADWTHTSISLPPEVGEWAPLTKWYEQYVKSIRASYEEQAAIMAGNRTEESEYTGAESCNDCHADSYNLWAGSRHSGAFQSLRSVEKAFDPSCLSCHTVGFRQPGGFIDTVVTPELINVQCEACHGVGKLHNESEGVELMPNSDVPMEQICVSCHTHENSPDFSRSAYWEQIKH